MGPATLPAGAQPRVFNGPTDAALSGEGASSAGRRAYLGQTLVTDAGTSDGETSADGPLAVLRAPVDAPGERPREVAICLRVNGRETAVAAISRSTPTGAQPRSAVTTGNLRWVHTLGRRNHGSYTRESGVPPTHDVHQDRQTRGVCYSRQKGSH